MILSAALADGIQRLMGLLSDEFESIEAGGALAACSCD